jgi:hypothetical protein
LQRTVKRNCILQPRSVQHAAHQRQRANSGYVSDYTLVTGTPYTDDVLTACSQSRGRENEPAIAVDPRNTQVIVGSSNDYCGVFATDGTFVGLGNVCGQCSGEKEEGYVLRY